MFVVSPDAVEATAVATLPVLSDHVVSGASLETPTNVDVTSKTCKCFEDKVINYFKK